MNYTSYNEKKARKPKSDDLERKRVRFAVTREGEILTEASEAKHSLDKSLWLNEDEWSDIRYSARKVVETVQKGDLIWSEARRHSYTKTMTKVWRACTEGTDLSNSTKEKLDFWITVGHSRRGLEKQSLFDIQTKCQQRRRDIFNSIMYVQDQCRSKGISYEKTAQYLRCESETGSIATKKFAHIVAASDARALAHDSEQRLTHVMIDKLCPRFSQRLQKSSITPTGELRRAKLVVATAAA